MDKKISRILARNLFLLVFTILMTFYLFRDIRQALYASNTGIPLLVNHVRFNLFYLELDVTQGDFSHLYTIFNYPFVSVAIAIVYNAGALLRGVFQPAQ